MDELPDTDIESRSPVPPDEIGLRPLVASLNAAADSARTGWITSLGLLAYLFVAVGGISHRDLLLNSPIKLPLLNVDVPLARFFIIAPLIVVVVHFGVLMQHAMAARKAAALNAALAEWERVQGSSHPIRMEVSSYFFIHSLAGSDRNSLLANLSRLLSFLTLELLPLCLLTIVLTTFLPFHDRLTTWVHRIYISGDVFLSLVFGVLFRFPDHPFRVGLFQYLRARRARFALSGATWCLVLLFVFCVATIPDELLDRAMRSIGPLSVSVSPTAGDTNRTVFSITAYLLEGDVNEITGRSLSPFSRNLIVPDANFFFTERQIR